MFVNPRSIQPHNLTEYSTKRPMVAPFRCRNIRFNDDDSAYSRHPDRRVDWNVRSQAVDVMLLSSEHGYSGIELSTYGRGGISKSRAPIQRAMPAQLAKCGYHYRRHDSMHGVGNPTSTIYDPSAKRGSRIVGMHALGYYTISYVCGNADGMCRQSGYAPAPITQLRKANVSDMSAMTITHPSKAWDHTTNEVRYVNVKQLIHARWSATPLDDDTVLRDHRFSVWWQ